MDAVQLSQGYRTTARRHLVFTTKSPGVPGIYLINLYLMTLELYSGFELRTPGLAPQHSNHSGNIRPPKFILCLALYDPN